MHEHRCMVWIMGIDMFIHSFVCLMKVCLFIIFWPQILQDDFMMTSG